MDIEQMEVLENALAEINEAEGMTGVRTWIEEIDSLMGKMGYKRFLSWSGTYKRMPTSPNVNNNVRLAGETAKKIEASLQRGNDVVYIGWEDWSLYETRIISVECPNLVNLKIQMGIFEEGELVDDNVSGYDTEEDKESFFRYGLKAFLDNWMPEAEGNTVELALNALGLRKGEGYETGKGYQEIIRFISDDKPQMWYHNDAYIPRPFNTSIPESFQQKLRNYNVKV